MFLSHAPGPELGGVRGLVVSELQLRGGGGQLGQLRPGGGGGVQLPPAAVTAAVAGGQR